MNLTRETVAKVVVVKGVKGMKPRGTGTVSLLSRHQAGQALEYELVRAHE